MTRLNCPNCGAPIDIHRRDCEYCGTPYDLKDREVLYADNQPVYIYQDPIEWNVNALERINKSLRQSIDRTSISICNTEAKLKLMEAQLQAKNLEAWQHELTRQCCNALPKASYGPLIEPKVEVIGTEVSDIWETVKIVLITVAFFLPVLIPIILGVFDII